MTPLQSEIIKDLLYIEQDMGGPTFILAGNTYTLIPSVAEFKRSLDTGGFQLVRMLTATVRKLNADGSNVFTTLPTAQQRIIYNGDNYRIESVRTDPTGTHFRIIAESTTKGI